MNCFTLEASFHGYITKESRQTTELTCEMLVDMGRCLAKAFNEYLFLVEDDERVKKEIRDQQIKNKKKNLQKYKLAKQEDQLVGTAKNIAGSLSEQQSITSVNSDTEQKNQKIEGKKQRRARSGSLSNQKNSSSILNQTGTQGSKNEDNVPNQGQGNSLLKNQIKSQRNNNHGINTNLSTNSSQNYQQQNQFNGYKTQYNSSSNKSQKKTTQPHTVTNTTHVVKEAEKSEDELSRESSTSKERKQLMSPKQGDMPQTKKASKKLQATHKQRTFTQTSNQSQPSACNQLSSNNGLNSFRNPISGHNKCQPQKRSLRQIYQQIRAIQEKQELVSQLKKKCQFKDDQPQPQEIEGLNYDQIIEMDEDEDERQMKIAAAKLSNEGHNQEVVGSDDDLSDEEMKNLQQEILGAIQNFDNIYNNHNSGSKNGCASAGAAYKITKNKKMRIMKKKGSSIIKASASQNHQYEEHQQTTTAAPSTKNQSLNQPIFSNVQPVSGHSSSGASGYSSYVNNSANISQQQSGGQQPFQYYTNCSNISQPLSRKKYSQNDSSINKYIQQPYSSHQNTSQHVAQHLIVINSSYQTQPQQQKPSQSTSTTVPTSATPQTQGLLLRQKQSTSQSINNSQLNVTKYQKQMKDLKATVLNDVKNIIITKTAQNHIFPSDARNTSHSQNSSLVPSSQQKQNPILSQDAQANPINCQVITPKNKLVTQYAQQAQQQLILQSQSKKQQQCQYQSNDAGTLNMITQLAMQQKKQASHYQSQQNNTNMLREKNKLLNGNGVQGGSQFKKVTGNNASKHISADLVGFNQRYPSQQKQKGVHDSANQQSNYMNGNKKMVSMMAQMHKYHTAKVAQSNQAQNTSANSSTQSSSNAYPQSQQHYPHSYLQHSLGQPTSQSNANQAIIKQLLEFSQANPQGLSLSSMKSKSTTDVKAAYLASNQEQSDNPTTSQVQAAVMELVNRNQGCNTTFESHPNGHQARESQNPQVLQQQVPLNKWTQMMYQHQKQEKETKQKLIQFEQKLQFDALLRKNHPQGNASQQPKMPQNKAISQIQATAANNSRSKILQAACGGNSAM